MIEAWKRVWRDGVSPLLSDESLAALRDALVSDDKRLIQGRTTEPLPHFNNMGDPPLGACAISYCGWIGDGLCDLEELESYFASMCAEIDKAVGEPAGHRYFLTWYDSTKRDVMRRELLPEVMLSIADRGHADYITSLRLADTEGV